MYRGWIRLYRRLKYHWIWKESGKFHKREAWIALLLEANHKDKKSLKGMSVIEVKRGQVLTSQLKLASEWGWNRKTVKRFLDLLQKHDMIRYKTVSGGDSGYTLISLCNYDKFQDRQDNERGNETDTEMANEGTSEGTTEGQRRDTNKNDNNEKNDKNGKHNKENKVHFPFEELWHKYPSKVGRKQAERHFKTSVKSQKNWENIHKALDNYLKSERVAKGYVQNGSTWFRDWQDWVNFIEEYRPKLTPAQEASKRSLEEFAEEHGIK